MQNKFKILHQDGKARSGILETAHGAVETPNFIPVGTKASVKALSNRDLEEIGVQIILSNTYHLMLRPGDEVVKKLGGLHKFMNWDKPMMTDSGGYQVFSLGVGLQHGGSKVLRKVANGKQGSGNLRSRPRLNKISEEGVTFQSHLDGKKYMLTPESSIQIQVNLGADLIVAFDDHESGHYNHEETLTSVELTERWAERSLNALKKLKTGQLMYGVVHGGEFKDLRIRSAKFTDKYFDAIAIGGIYHDKKTLNDILEWTVKSVSEEKVKHLLGIGEIENLFDAVDRGIDLFDCVAPTRLARHGFLYPGINIRLAKYKEDKNPIKKDCSCFTCQNHTRAYLHYLLAAGELLYYRLAAYHNVFFISNLMRKIREAIKEGSFKKLKAKTLRLKGS